MKPDRESTWDDVRIADQTGQPTPTNATAPKRGIFHSQPLHAVQIADALLKKQTVGAVTGLSGSTIDRKTKAGEFPKPVKLGARCTRWRAADVRAWLAAQVVG